MCVYIRSKCAVVGHDIDFIHIFYVCACLLPADI
jgi:hypothetical protein